jgi:uncharacterized lipoprotein YmbA
MNPTWPPRAVLLICTAALLSSACSSAPTRIYTLYAVAPTTTRTTYTGPPLRVDAVYFPPALDRIEIMRDLGSGQVSLSDTDHWSAPLGETAREALSADLVARLPPNKTIFPRLPKPDGALGLIVDVLAFHTDGQSAELEVSWVVGAAGQPAAASSGSATLHSREPAANAAATAQALSSLLAQLADRIVAGL